MHLGSHAEKGETVEEQDETLKGNKFAILATEGEEPLFDRQVRKRSPQKDEWEVEGGERGG